MEPFPSKPLSHCCCTVPDLILEFSLDVWRHARCPVSVWHLHRGTAGILSVEWLCTGTEDLRILPLLSHFMRLTSSLVPRRDTALHSTCGLKSTCHARFITVMSIILYQRSKVLKHLSHFKNFETLLS